MIVKAPDADEVLDFLYQRLMVKRLRKKFCAAIGHPIRWTHYRNSGFVGRVQVWECRCEHRHIERKEQ